MEKTNVMLEFCIFGEDFDIDEVTKRLMLYPTTSYKKGSLCNNARIKRKETSWNLTTGYVETLYIEELFDELLDKLEDKREVIIKLEEELNVICKFFLVINIYENIKPAIYFDKRIIEFSNFIKAEIDVDLYIY